MTLPLELTYGYVVGRVILAVADGPDTDRMPDAKPASGTVTFTPKNLEIRIGEPDPVVVLKQKIACSLDVTGHIVDSQESPGVWLVTGLYAVSYSFTAASIPSHEIEVTASHTEGAPLDLTLAMPPGGPVVTPTQYTELLTLINAVDTGGTGTKGDPGTDGTDGADGDSAYEVAVTSGFVGTETEWLASLVGPKGEPGQDGADGQDGAQGLKGDTGEAGADGQDGDPATVNLTTIPAGSTLTVYYGTTWPSRPTARTDVTVQWVDLTGTAGAPAGALEDHDLVIIPGA